MNINFYTKKLLTKEFILQLFLVLLWLSLISSINVKITDIKSDFDNIFNLLNIFRFFSPFFFFFIIIFLIKENFKEIFQDFYKKNKLNFLFLILFIISFFSTFIQNGLLFEHGLSWVNLLFFCIFACINIHILTYKKYKNLLKYFLFFTTLIFFIIALVFFISRFDEWIIRLDFYNYSLFSLEKIEGFSQAYPRITGLSRMFALSYILSLIFLLKNKLSLKIKLFFFIILLISGGLVWSFQSRGTILCLLISVFFLMILERKNFVKRFAQIIFLLILSIFTYELFGLAFKEKIAYEGMITKKVIDTKLQSERIESGAKSQNRILTTNQTSSGRIDLWKNAIESYNYKKILGYGVQADRFIIDKKLASYVGNNVSNAYISVFLMGGYLGLLIILLVIFRLCKIIFIFTKNIYIIENKYIFEIYTSLIFTIFFLTRSLFENSFAVFGTDFLFFILSISVLEFYFRLLKSRFR